MSKAIRIIILGLVLVGLAVAIVLVVNSGQHRGGHGEATLRAPESPATQPLGGG